MGENQFFAALSLGIIASGSAYFLFGYMFASW